MGDCGKHDGDDSGDNAMTFIVMVTMVMIFQVMMSHGGDDADVVVLGFSDDGGVIDHFVHLFRY